MPSHPTKAFRKSHLWIPIIAVFIILLGSPAPPGLSLLGWRAIAIFSLVVMLWVTELVPLPVAAILGGVLQPLLGIATVTGALAGFASSSVFLILAGFIIAAGLVKTGLDKRIAYSFVGISKKPERILLGLILATGILSMIISNTATVLLMLPIAVTLAAKTGLDKKMLLLAIAFAANIGGVGLLVGTPPNVMAAQAVGWGFYQWMWIGLPFAFIMLFALWLSFRIQFKPHRVRHAEKMEKLGPMKKSEKKCALVILFTLFLWVTEPLHGIDSVIIGLAGGLLMFILLFDWRFFEKETDWGSIILIGGAISIANALAATGAAAWIAEGFLGTTGLTNPILIVFGFCMLALLVTQFIQNTATAGMFIPILVGLAQQAGFSPASTVILPSIAVSMTFLLPPGTAPNAIVHGKGGISTKEMLRAGILPTVFAIILLLVFSFVFVGRI
ncbi:MAG: DASS family sodium-coupled anion symporter [Candidatus Aenigmarchaeota archaeon]|nr:DASS family sodium-coupled anion symporter [Candidatus Aenigmarchaeota archaeon]